jgi:hypothetical protein
VTTDAERHPDFDELRVISLPPPQTAAVNRLLREEHGWVVLDVRVTERPGGAAGCETVVVYVMGHRAAATDNGKSNGGDA